MKTIEKIKGETSGYNPNLTMTWEDPITGDEMIAWGEFQVKNGKYIHEVYNVNGLQYIVEAD